MKKITFLICKILLLLFLQLPLWAQALNIVTWNLHNFGKSKLAKGDIIEYIAQTLRDVDIIAIQEISTGPFGAKAVAALADSLNRKGAKFDYIVSDPTSGVGSERYAYIFRPSKVELIGRGFLEPSLSEEIDREPYMARFRNKVISKQGCDNNACFILANFHAVPVKKNPQKEIKLLASLIEKYSDENLIFWGDFNLSYRYRVYDAFYSNGYYACLVEQRTSLKRKISKGQHLANEYDNIFLNKKYFVEKKCFVSDFTNDFETLKEALQVSDHLPVWLKW